MSTNALPIGAKTLLMNYASQKTRAGLLACALMAAGVSPVVASAQAENTLLTYPVPVPVMYQLHNDDYTVRVRTPGGEWQDLYEYRIRVDWDAPQDASMVYFDFEGVVDIEVQKNNGAFENVSVAPLSSEVRLQRTGSNIRTTLTKAERFSLQFDDDRLHNLHILAGSLPSPRPTGRNVRYFEPGVHTPPAGSQHFSVRAGDRIYLAGGAILRGAFALEGVQDVEISGRGLIYDPGHAIDLNRAGNVRIRDLILVNTEREAGARFMNIRNSENVEVNEVSGFTAGKWADGFNISTSRRVRIDGGYLRTSDDAVVVYAVTDCPICGDKPIPPLGPTGAVFPADTYDIRVSNLRIWNDVAHALYVGHFGDNSAPRTIRDVTFDNIDVANLDEDDPAWEGAMAVFSGDSTLIRNITFSNIRVDRIEEGKLINIVAGKNGRYNQAPGRGIDGVILRNISFTGEGMPSRSIISGQSAQTEVRNVVIEGLSIAGRRVSSPVDIDIGPHVNGMTVR